jgi:hypothetical protein
LGAFIRFGFAIGLLGVCGVLVVASTGSRGLPDRTWSLFQTHAFVPVSSENSPLDAPAPTSLTRALDLESPRPAIGAALKGALEEQGGSGAGGAFPLLVPFGFGDTEQSIAASRLRLRLMEGGYYTVFQSQTMEITILGTRRVWQPGEGALGEVQSDYVMPFEDPGPIPAGGAIAFGHFGADYSVTFDCVDTSPGQNRNCISAEDARDLVASLVAGTPTHLRLPPFVSS